VRIAARRTEPATANPPVPCHVRMSSSVAGARSPRRANQRRPRSCTVRARASASRASRAVASRKPDPAPDRWPDRTVPYRSPDAGGGRPRGRRPSPCPLSVHQPLRARGVFPGAGRPGKLHADREVVRWDEARSGHHGTTVDARSDWAKERRGDRLAQGRHSGPGGCHLQGFRGGRQRIDGQAPRPDWPQLS